MHTFIGLAVGFIGSNIFMRGGDSLFKYVLLVVFPYIVSMFFGGNIGWFTFGVSLVAGYGRGDGYPISEIRAKYNGWFCLIGFMIIIYAAYQLIMH